MTRKVPKAAPVSVSMVGRHVTRHYSGLRHNDAKRSIGVLRLQGRDVLGVVLRMKGKRPHGTKFSISKQGAKILGTLLIRAATARPRDFDHWKEKHWEITPGARRLLSKPDRNKPKGDTRGAERTSR